MNFFLLLFTFFDFFNFHSNNDIQTFISSVVNIEAHSFQYSYEVPWSPPQIKSSGGSGFIIELNNKKYIITNAHVVSNAVQIRVRRNGQNKFFFAKVKHIAHDCDLALLDIDEDKNYDEFYKNSKPLEFGSLPELNSPVMVIGFPIGGEKISITQGIVSRIDMDTYSHSGVDSHLVIQVDAAINPGNSGGPALQNGKVIGIAFQILKLGENLGYLIPTPVIQKFLKDISLDGKYDGYMELGVLYQSTENSTIKKALNLPETLKNYGVLIYDIVPDSSADGYIKRGDILWEIQGFKITDNGDVFINNEYRNFIELVDNLEKGELIHLKIYRNQKFLDITIPAKITKFLDFQRKNYDSPPEFLLYGGLLFQPLSSDLLSTYSSTWLANNRSEMFYYYFYSLQSRLQEKSNKNDQKIILTKVLPNSKNDFAKEFQHRIIKTINGKKVYNLLELWKYIEQESKNSNYITFEFEGEIIPLVFSVKDLQKIHQEIIQSYGINKFFYFKE